MKKIFALAVCVLILSCNKEAEKLSKEFDTKMIETMAVHDEVMPKMTEINNMINRLEASIDSVNQGRYEDAMKDLENSHGKMMSWMKDFGNSFTQVEIHEGIETENIDSIKVKLEKINKSYQDAEEMKLEIQNAIVNADRVLNSQD